MSPRGKVEWQRMVHKANLEESLHSPPAAQHIQAEKASFLLNYSWKLMSNFSSFSEMQLYHQLMHLKHIQSNKDHKKVSCKCLWGVIVQHRLHTYIINTDPDISFVEYLHTYDKCINNNAWNGDATAKFESHINVDVGWETSADTKHQ